MASSPELVTAAVPAAGVVVGALWYALSAAGQGTNPAKAITVELARGLYWCSLLVTLLIVAKMTLSL